jgi:hypothetical protein
MCSNGATCLFADLFRWATTIKIQLSVLAQYKADLIIISFKIDLSSPWYTWKTADLPLNNNHLLTIKVLWLWYLMPFSTIFQLFRGYLFIGGGNRSTGKKTNDLSQVTDKLYHIMLHRVHLATNMVRTHNFSAMKLRLSYIQKK